jgi:hypothetical protein
MEIYHKIPSWRLQKEYLIPFFQGIGLSRYITRMLSIRNSWARPMIFFAYFINDVRKVFWHLVKYHLKVKNDLVAACEMQLMFSSLISPFYWLKNGYRNNI